MDETPGRIEPAFLSGDIPSELVGLSTELVVASAKLPGRLPSAAAVELAGLVRIMNCYYSNLIEGHKTRPVDIEKALASTRPEMRPLLQEAKAHVAVQKHLDEAFLAGELGVPTSVGFIKDLHRRFYEQMPADLRTSTFGDRTVPIVPGAFRARPEEDVAVGRHHPPSSSRVADFMDHYARRFADAGRSSAQRVLAIPAAHHRLNFVHPFVDGNGRVSRLVSHAMALRAGIGCNGLWSISRGLARGRRDPSEYRTAMDAADRIRQGSTDGRGNLSEKALVEFSAWFLDVALDQVDFCARAFDLDNLGGRYRSLARVASAGDDRPGKLIARVLALGDVERGLAGPLLGLEERTARKVLSNCVERGWLKSDTPKGPVRVGFPVEDRAWLFPGLFADEGPPERPRPLQLSEPAGPRRGGSGPDGDF